MKPDLLLHSCCAPCSPYVMELLSKDYNIFIYFYNPNIYPQEEYLLRADEINRLCSIMQKPLIIGNYESDFWFESIKGLENEPEKGKRCETCFQLRIESSMRKAIELGIPSITTTLTVSPLKDAQCINLTGLTLASKYGINFIAQNFKKQNGFKLTCELSRKYNFYRQNYCGCIFSRNKKPARF